MSEQGRTQDDLVAILAARKAKADIEMEEKRAQVAKLQAEHQAVRDRFDELWSYVEARVTSAVDQANTKLKPIGLTLVFDEMVLPRAPILNWAVRFMGDLQHLSIRYEAVLNRQLNGILNVQIHRSEAIGSSWEQSYNMENFSQTDANLLINKLLDLSTGGK